MEIKNTTVYTKARLIAFTDYLAKIKTPYWIIYSICTFIVLAGGVILVLLDAMTAEMIMLTALVIFVDLLMVLVFLIIPRLTVTKSKTFDAVLSYVFRADEVVFEAETELMKDSGSFKYPALVKVCKNKDDVYLFIAKNQAYVVDVSELSGLELDALKSLVTSHLPARKVKWK